MSDWNGVPEDWGKGHYRDVPISRYVRLCRDRQISDLKKAQAKDPNFPYYWDEEAADHAVWFFSELVQFEGDFAGQKLVLADWQEWDIIRPIFGWKKLLNGKRRFTQADVFIPRRMGKSTIAGGIGALLLLGDREYGAQIYCAATKEKQAAIVWKATKKLLMGSRRFKKYIKAYSKSIICERLDSFVQKLGRDSKTEDGLNVHGGIVDEYHAHKTADMLNVLDSGTGNRSQSLIFLISSFGLSGEGSPCQREDKYCRDILEGTIVNDQFFCFLSTVDDPEKWDQEEEWYKANPNLGISVTIEKFREDFLKAKQKPDSKIEFLSKKLNIWCSSARSWIDINTYNSYNAKVNWEKFKGKDCVGAFDLGISKDLSAFALAFLEPETVVECDKLGNIILPKVYLKLYYWMPKDNIKARSEEDRVPYDQWVEQGFMTATPGRTTRRDIIRADINKIGKIYNIKSIVGDQFNAFELLENLASDNFKVAKHPQTMVAMNLPTRTFEDLVLEKRLMHDDNPVLRWNISNCVVVKDGNENIKVVKNKCKDRVDGATAGVMAVGRLLLQSPPKKSKYNNTRLVVAG